MTLNSSQPCFQTAKRKRPLEKKLETRGPFLESPGNFSGPKSNTQIEI